MATRASKPADAFAINRMRNMTVEVHPVAPGVLPVIVIDNFYAQPDRMRQLGLSLSYTHQRAAYPGLEASAQISGFELVSFLTRLTRQAFGDTWCLTPILGSFPRFKVPSARQLAPVRPAPREALFRGAPSFSVDETIVFSVYHEPRKVYPDLPHFDTEQHSSQLAMVLYLNPPEQCAGGTQFFRHRPTNLTAAVAHDDPRARRLLKKHGLPSVAALNRRIIWSACGEYGADASEWEVVHLVEMRYNRLVLFDGSLLHGLRAPRGAFGRTLDTMRLTQNVFFSGSHVGQLAKKSKAA